MEEKKKLTDKQRRFCEEYVIDWNGTRAAIAAGYSEKTAKQIATENLSKPYLREHINEILSDLSKLTGVTAVRNILELKKIAYTNIGDLKKSWTEFKDFDQLTDDQKASIAEIVHTQTEFEGGEKNSFKIKMHDKMKAIGMLNKMLGFEVPDEDTKDNSFKGTMVIQVGANGIVPLPSEENQIKDFTDDPEYNDQ